MATPSIPRPVLRVAAVAAVLLGLASFVSRQLVRTEQEQTRNDFTQDYASAVAWQSGDDPYGRLVEIIPRHLGPGASTDGYGPRQRNPHVPFQVVVVAPFTSLPYALARALWLALMTAAFVGGIATTARALGAGRGEAFALGMGMLVLPVPQIYLQVVQVEGLTLLLLAVAWRDLRARNDVRAGCLLGLAAALKLYPAFMLIPLLRWGRTRAAAVTAGVAAVLGAAGALLIGPAASRTFLTSATRANFDFWAPAPTNVSLVGLPFRWLTPNAWLPDLDDRSALATVVAAAIMLGCAVAALKTPARASGEVYWAAVPWMLLASPLSWEFTLILVYPLGMIMAVEAHRKGDRLPLWLLVCMGATVLGFAGMDGAPGRVNDLQMIAFMAPTLGLAGIAAVEWRAGRRAPKVVADPPGYSV